MTALDTLRQDVEEARKAREGAFPGEEFINATDTLLFEKICAAQHRASRRATLEEVRKAWRDDDDFADWLKTQLEAP